jgi:hypothetical protein
LFGPVLLNPAGQSLGPANKVKLRISHWHSLSPSHLLEKSKVAGDLTRSRVVYTETHFR